MQKPMQTPAHTASRFRRLRLMRDVGIAVLVLAPLQVAAEPGTSTPLEPTKAATKAAYEKQVVCSYRTPIGSRIPRKSCTTRAQADAESAMVEEKMREMGRASDRNAALGAGSQPIR